MSEHTLSIFSFLPIRLNGRVNIRDGRKKKSFEKKKKRKTVVVLIGYAPHFILDVFVFFVGQIYVAVDLSLVYALFYDNAQA